VPLERTTKRVLIGMAIIASILFAIALVLSNFLTCHCTDKADTIVNCLSELDAAKIQWTIDHKGVTVTNFPFNSLSPYVITDFWNRPIAGETYFINKIDEPCSVIVPKRTDWIPANSELRFSSLDSNRKVQIRSTTPGSAWTTP
jgi:hypothetical protein